jgi:hypothetical protein
MFNITETMPVEKGPLRLRYIFMCVVFVLTCQRMAYPQVASYCIHVRKLNYFKLVLC